jgi:hypothetical protein
MILHESVEKNLILIPHGCQESVLENDGGLLLQLVVSSRDLLIEVVDFVRQHTLQAKDGAFLSSKCGTLVQSRGVEQLVASDICSDWDKVLGLAAGDNSALHGITLWRRRDIFEVSGFEGSGSVCMSSTVLGVRTHF